MRIAGLFVFLASPGLIFGFQPPSRIHADIKSSQTFALPGNTRPILAQAQDQGSVSSAFQLPSITLHLAMTASQRAELLQLLADQQTPGSSHYRQWLTPEEYADRFGVNPTDLQKMVAWLDGLGFSNIEVARSRNAVTFSGTAAQAESAFQTPIRRYLVNGESHFANASDPILPKALEGMVESIRGLHDFHPKPRGIRSTTALQAHFTSSISGSHFLVPDDFATIYDVKPLYANGIDGTGQKIAIPGQSDIALSDIEAFRTAAGLPQNDPQVILTGPDPGTKSADEGESDLDIEWAGGIAKNATIIFVNSRDVLTSEIYAVDNNVAPVLSITYGTCETDAGAAEINTLTTLFQQANAQGITVVAASGDGGAADCDGSSAKATHGLAVDVPAAIPYVTGLGGTELSEGSGTYWSSANDANSGSALSYIPEIAWNGTATDGVLSASGGGKSVSFSKPSWQTGTGVPYDGARDVPDLALAASPDHDGFLVCSAGSCVNGFRRADTTLNVVGGTSAAAPSFAAIVALLNQQTGHRQGNINPALYALASVSTDAFHDITQGNNIVPCRQASTDCPTGGELGYSTWTGYDLVTGLGSVDAYNLLREWSNYTPAPLIAMPAGAQQISVGADGAVWGINTGGEVYSYNSQNMSWTAGSQTLSQIAVGSSGAAWGLTAAGNIYRFDSSSQTWVLVPGNLSQIAVGSDGAVWGLSSLGSIFTFDSQTQSWNRIPGVLSQIAVGFDGAVWGLNPSGQIYRFNPGAQAFDYVAGTLAQISAGADGDVWGINSSGSVYHFDRLIQGWEQSAGTLKAVSVGSGSNVWGLNPESNVFKFDRENGIWTEVGGALLRSISASANGSVWGVDYSNQSYQLVQATQASQTWHQLPGALAKIAVSSDGNVWGINAANQTYTFNPLTQGWTFIPGALSQIAVAANGSIWGLNALNQVYRFDASTQQFDLLPGSLSQIAVADTGDAWGLNAQNQIYRFNSSNQIWTLVPGSLAQISVGADGDAWGIDSQNSVYHFDIQTQTWKSISAKLSQISVGSSANVWGLDANGNIYRFNAADLALDPIPGSLAHITAAFDGAVWGINSGGEVYRFDSQTQSWVNIPGALATIAAGSDAIVWGINSGGQIYRFQ